MQARERGLPGIVCALIAGAALCVPASAGATVRFASPTGMSSGDCGTTVTACTLRRAVEVVAVNGDEVIVLPGTYAESTDLTVAGAKTVHAAVGQAPPNLIFNSPAGVAVSGGSLLERLTVVQQGGGNSACFVEGAAVIRDTVCWATGANGVGLRALADMVGVSGVLRNVTIEGTGGAARGIVGSASNGGNLLLDVKNTIVRGAPPSPDVEAATLDATSAATVTLERSNYGTTSATGAGAEAVTSPGTNSNQVAEPLLASRFTGDFHQLPSSPTVDAGGSFTPLGSFDIDGEPRTVEGASSCFPGIARPDIGADELVPDFRDCVAPETGIVKGPKRKTRKRRASFELTSTEIGTFQCSLDERPFSPCASPHVYRKLRTGKHIFAVRALDRAGNLDASPAERVWRVRAKKKRKRRARK